MCKLEKYGNCDSETKDRDYCIFHKPSKTEEEAKEFWRKFLVRFKPKKEGIYNRILKEDIERFVFEDEVNCRGFVFPKIPPSVDFKFEGVIFKSSINFSHAKFCDLVDFTGAIFKDFVDFSHAHFDDGAEFGGVVFEDFANFSDATFKGKTQFDYSQFKGGATFNKAKFLTFYISFWSVKFFDEVNFIETIFGGIVHFINTCFSVSDIVSFKKAVFKGKAEFINSIFRDFADFSGKPKEEECKFYDELSFEIADFSKGLNIDIPSEWFKLPQAEAEACRVQRLFYEKEGKKDDADRMFVWERRAIRRAVVKKVKEELKHSKNTKSKLGAMFGLIKTWISSVIERFLADLTCEYGTNWKRPILLWLIVVLGTSLIYWLTNSVPNAHDFWSNLYFSIVTATTLGYGDLHPVGWGRALASFEAIFGTFMWAVFLVVFARKYMR